MHHSEMLFCVSWEGVSQYRQGEQFSASAVCSGGVCGGGWRRVVGAPPLNSRVHKDKTCA